MDKTIRDYSFNLPERLIAQEPPEVRGTAGLMVLNPEKGSIEHRNMQDFTSLLEPGTVIVLNDSKVRRARLFGHNSVTGGKVEFFLLDPLPEGKKWLCMVNKSKKQKVGKRFDFPGGLKGIITAASEGNQRTVEFSQVVTDEYLEEFAHIPLPPYIKREDTPEDASRYQSVFAKITGSVAAPTASLHFTEEILADLQKKGVEIAYITLHVGLGTFEPVRAETLDDHTMHSETFSLSEKTALIVEKAMKEKRPVLAVGTTSVRTLESAWNQETEHFKRGWQETRLFIRSGFKFQVVTQLFTNFHTPESTLLVLVSTFAGKEFIEKAYQEGIEKEYRFFSYGDGMLIKNSV